MKPTHSRIVLVMRSQSLLKEINVTIFPMHQVKISHEVNITSLLLNETNIFLRYVKWKFAKGNQCKNNFYLK